MFQYNEQRKFLKLLFIMSILVRDLFTSPREITAQVIQPEGVEIHQLSFPTPPCPAPCTSLREIIAQMIQQEGA